MKKILFIFLLIFVGCVPVYAIDSEKNTLAPNAKSAIVIEAETGEVIYQHNADEKLAPASMTKMMSLLLIMEAIDKGVIKLDDIVTVSQNASAMGGSQILLEVGEQMSVNDLIKGIAVASANELA